MTYVILFFEFFKIGLFAVGGGLATLPFLYELAPLVIIQLKFRLKLPLQ
jgi:hypothetical protein